MQSLLKPHLSTFVFLLAFPCTVKAENTFMDWEVQLYGGKYYEDKRIGTYSIASNSFLNDFTITGEFMHERYSDYNFSGVGGHLIWETSKTAKFGLVGSLLDEEFTTGADLGNQESNDISDTLGLSAELNQGAFTLAVQRGKNFNKNYNNNYNYLSMDIYYWGAEYLWYARGAIRRTENYKEYTIEGYRTFYVDELPLNLYVGVTRNDLDTKEEIRIYHTSFDSFYAGCYFDFLTTSSSRWNLLAEASRQEDDTIFSVELNIAFGPGVDGPYITAFGFSPW